MATMRAVDIKGGTGPPSALFINPDIPKPVPTAAQCLIHVKAFGLNRADTLQRVGKYPVPPGVTKIMGMEFSGVVEEVGQERDDVEDRHHWKRGDEVFGLAYGGAYAEYIAVDKHMLIRRPKELSWEICGGACEVWFTALQALHLVGEYAPATTRSILWHAGGSSVSIAGIQLSRAANHHHASASSKPSTSTSHKDLPPPKVFATARQDSKVDFCVQTLGCIGAVNPTTAPGNNWAAEIKRLNGDAGIDLVIDFVGASYFAQNLDVLAQDGRVVQLGTMGGVLLPAETDVSAFLRKRVRFQGSTLRSRDPAYQGRLRDLFEELVLPGLLDGTFDNRVDQALDWAEVGRAHELLEANKTMGKLVCVVDW